jgi:uncharacterized iron-regulated protein
MGVRVLPLSVACAAILLVTANAWSGPAPGIYDGYTGQAVDLSQALGDVHAGHIVVIGEEHDDRQHHENELAVLRALLRQSLRVSVGMEFLAYPDQPFVDRYVRGDMAEADFLSMVHWGGTPFAWYRPLVLFPRDAGGETVALNAPEALTRAIAQQGLDALSDEERGLLPPGFGLGNALYFERFAREVQQHGRLTDAAVSNFFAAQSAWDDTMAWRAVTFISAHPDQVLVIVVGDFHVAYGGGLPDRLRARGAPTVWTISQVGIEGLSEAEMQARLNPDSRYGPRADYIWLTGR